MCMLIPIHAGNHRGSEFRVSIAGLCWNIHVCVHVVSRLLLLWLNEIFRNIVFNSTHTLGQYAHTGIHVH